MSSPFQYFGGGSHMAAVLKRDIARVRRAKPERHVPKRVELKEIDEDGRVKVTGVVYESACSPPTPRALHALSLQRERF